MTRKLTNSTCLVFQYNRIEVNRPIKESDAKLATVIVGDFHCIKRLVQWQVLLIELISSNDIGNLFYAIDDI